MYASVTDLITLHMVPASLCEFWQRHRQFYL